MNFILLECNKPFLFSFNSLIPMQPSTTGQRSGNRSDSRTTGLRRPVGRIQRGGGPAPPPCGAGG